ncbi:hypothetical protein DFAR_1110032 [Desulfarculales bacterium]
MLRSTRKNSPSMARGMTRATCARSEALSKEQGAEASQEKDLELGKNGSQARPQKVDAAVPEGQLQGEEYHADHSRQSPKLRRYIFRRRRPATSEKLIMPAPAVTGRAPWAGEGMKQPRLTRRPPSLRSRAAG